MPAGRREAVMDPHFIEDLDHWTRTDRRRALRALELIEAILWHPFERLGKPQLLRGRLASKWSRRIGQEHRLVYAVEEKRIYFLAARHHYLLGE